jgi:hypothetical protein
MSRPPLPSLDEDAGIFWRLLYCPTLRTVLLGVRWRPVSDPSEIEYPP